MAYDKFLTQRFRDGLGNISGVTEKKNDGRRLLHDQWKYDRGLR